MLFEDYQCLFVHIPKAAGNSIKKAFDCGWDDHKDLQRYREELGAEKLASLFTFTFVRNPFDRLFSEYNFQRKKSERKDTVRLWLFKPDGSERTFEEWVTHAFAHPLDHESREWGGKPSEAVHRLSPQIEWLSLDGELRVDYVGKIENLQEDFDAICERVNKPRVRLKRRNRKFHWHYSRYYPEALREKVEAYYAKDLEAFGYSF